MPLPRVPLPASADLFGLDRSIQVNHCRMPECENYGIPARHQHGKRGPSPDRDMHYKVHSTKKGKVPSVRCKSCKDNPPVKSNASIASEIERFIDVGGLRPLEELKSCRNLTCDNLGRDIASNRHCYQKRGKPKSGGQYYRCKGCGQFILVSDPVRLHKRNRGLAVDVFSRIVNKAPMRRTVKGANLKSNVDYYSILKFIHSRCRAYSGAVDRALIDGRLRLRPVMNIEADAKVYTLNWISRLDRRNVEISCYTSVDSRSRFIFGMHSNFDPRIDPFEANQEAAELGEMQIPEAFRRYAHYWLAGDELGAGRAMSRSVVDRDELVGQIETLYRQAAARRDVENIELHQMNSAYRTPFLASGLQIHVPYIAYAHWFLLHRILTGAGVKKVQANIDIDSMSRAAFLCAFVDEIKRGDAHLFFVKYRKYLTVDQRKHRVAQSRRALANYAATLPAEEREHEYQVAHAMMKEILQGGQVHGKWSDRWFHHPMPTMNEPEKAVSWMTPDDSASEDLRAFMFLRAGIARVDNVFQMTRRLINAFERPIGTSSGYNTVWHGYAPYNPAMVQTYLTIFRTVNNFVHVSEEDGKTPAMRLGLMKRPVDLEDILWPGQRVPRPKRARRRGRAMTFDRQAMGR